MTIVRKMNFLNIKEAQNIYYYAHQLVKVDATLFGKEKSLTSAPSINVTF